MKNIIPMGTLLLIMLACTENCLSLTNNPQNNNSQTNLSNNHCSPSHLQQISRLPKKPFLLHKDSSSRQFNGAISDYMGINNAHSNDEWLVMHNQYIKFSKKAQNPLLTKYITNELCVLLGYKIPPYYQNNLPRMPKSICKLLAKNSSYDRINIIEIAAFFEKPESILHFTPEYDASTSLEGLTLLNSMTMGSSAHYDSMEILLKDICIMTPDLYLPKISMNTHHILLGLANVHMEDSDIPLLLLLSNIQDAVRKYNRFKTELEKYITGRAMRSYNKAKGGDWFSTCIQDYSNLLLTYTSVDSISPLSAFYVFFRPYFSFNKEGKIIKKSLLSNECFVRLVKIPLQSQGYGNSVFLNVNYMHRLYTSAPEQEKASLKKFIFDYHTYLYNKELLQRSPNGIYYATQFQYLDHITHMLNSQIHDEKLLPTNLSNYMISSNGLIENKKKLDLQYNHRYFNFDLMGLERVNMTNEHHLLMFNLISFICTQPNCPFKRRIGGAVPTNSEIISLIKNPGCNNGAINTLIDIMPDMKNCTDRNSMLTKLELLLTRLYLLLDDRNHENYLLDSVLYLDMIFGMLSSILENRNQSSIAANDDDQQNAAKILGYILNGSSHCWIGMSEGVKLAYDFVINTRAKNHTAEVCIYQAVSHLVNNVFQYINSAGTPFIERTMCFNYLLYLNKGKYGLYTTLSRGYKNTDYLAYFLSKSPIDSLPRKLWDGLSEVEKNSLIDNNMSTPGNTLLHAECNRIMLGLLEKLITPENVANAMIKMPVYSRAKEIYLGNMSSEHMYLTTNSSDSIFMEKILGKNLDQEMALKILEITGILVPKS
jgi:hypothetical protein